MIHMSPQRTALEHSRSVSILTILSLLLMTLCLSSPAQALEFRCEAPGDVRYLRVEIPGEERLCEVGVRYAATGERRVMWYADNDTMFCSAKAYELRDRYISEWNFDCSLWPDSDGIDNLSPTHRGILDNRLKTLINRGQTATPAFTVTAVRAKASSPLDKLPSTLALQFFLSSGDVTEIILDEGGKWELFATINNLATHITGDVSVETALINSITDGGALTVSTTVNPSTQQQCSGTQVLMVESNNQLQERTPHRYVCNSSVSARTDPG